MPFSTSIFMKVEVDSLYFSSIFVLVSLLNESITIKTLKLTFLALPSPNYRTFYQIPRRTPHLPSYLTTQYSIHPKIVLDSLTLLIIETLLLTIDPILLLLLLQFTILGLANR